MIKRKKIALLAGEADKKDQKKFVEGVLERAFHFDFDVCIFSMFSMYQNSTNREIGESKIYSLIPYNEFDAIIVFGDSIQTPGVIEQLDNELKNYYQGTVLFVSKKSEYFDSLLMDDYSLTKQVVTHLIETHKYRDIAYLAGKEWVFHTQIRLKGFRDCMSEHGLEVNEDRIFYGDFWYTTGESMVDKLMKNPDNLPEVIVCANDCMAIGVAEALEQVGVRVPEDIAIVGYDCSYEGITSPSPLTSIEAPYKDFGKYSVDYVVAKLKQEEIAPFEAKADLFIGRSCGCMEPLKKIPTTIRPRWATPDSELGFYSHTDTMLEDIMCQNTLADLYNVIFSYTYQIHDFDSFYLCMNKYWASEQELVNPENDWKDYSDEMLLAIRCGSKDSSMNVVGTSKFFKLEQMIPDINENHLEPKAYFFTPVYFEERCMGYSVISYGNKIQTYSTLYREWMRHVMKGLECFRRLAIVNQVKEKLQVSQYQDAITGLSNYMGFLKATEHLYEENVLLSLVAIDIKELSKINKQYGREEGTAVIAKMGSIVAKCKMADYCCCLGNDEFLLALKKTDDDIIEQARQEFVRNLEIENEALDKYKIEVVYGTTVGTVSCQKDMERLINEAVGRKNASKIVEQPLLDMANFTEEEKKMAGVVENILDDNMFTYHFQPIISAKTGEIFSYEALMRSTTEVRVSPLDILKYATAMNRLAEVERYTFLNVIDTVNANQDLFVNKKVFINSIPGVSLSETDLEIINQELYTHDGQLVVELTEQAELSDEELAKLKNKFAELGVETAVDDYGTGYSNITNLLRYMPRYVKIDRMLLTEIQNSPQKQHFVNEIIEFAHDNNIMALAEGVETLDELEMVIHLGADLIQGYYVAKPSAEIIQTIPVKIKREIHQINAQEQYSRNENIYFAGKEFRVSLAKLVSENYECIMVTNEEAAYRDLSIVGGPGINSNILVEISDGYRGHIILNNASFGGKRGIPCINIGEDCDVILELQGENELRTGGIRVPESSKLSIEGDGNLLIDCNFDNYYGIGNDMDKKHGDILFEHAGTVEIVTNGTLGAAIGSGLGGTITLAGGKTIVNMTGKKGVAVGSIYGDTTVDIHACDLYMKGSIYAGVGVGSIEGNVNCITKHIALNGRFSGTDLVGIGSHKGMNNIINVHNCSANIEVHGKRVSGLGALDGAAEISVKYAGVSLDEDADYVVVAGDFNQQSVLKIQDGEIMLEAKTKGNVMLGAKEENREFYNGRLNLKQNGEVLVV